LPWYLGGGAAQYCIGQGASCRWCVNELFGSAVADCGGGGWCISYVGGRGYWGVWYLDMWRRRGRLVGVVVLVVRLFEWRLLPLFRLEKDLDGVLELHKSCSFSVNVL
jgi:hypothetical protein